MIKVAITGNIASGKSVIQNYLISKGYKVIDTDDLAKTVRDENSALIIENFKDFDIEENGKISTQKLGNLVFENSKLRKKLDKIIHPLIFEKMEEFFNQNQDENIVFVGIPLLFETHAEKYFDKIIFVQSDNEIRLQRLMARNNLTEKEALNRINSQISQEEKIKNSEFVIYNNGDFNNIYSQIDKILNY